MSENKTVYVVTAGDYSDYHIEAIFDRKAMADHYAELYDRQNGTYRHGAIVEEWSLNQERDVVERGLICWTVPFGHSGAVGYVSGSLEIGEESFALDEPRFVSKFDDDPREFTCTTMQKDKETAIKVCAERRAQYLAEKAGIT